MTKTIEYAEPDLGSYDTIIIALSGGKDSLAMLLHLLELGVDPSKLELWHHDVDGREGSQLMDWKVTPSYCQALAQYFDIPIYFSWREGGFEDEMLRDEQPTNKTYFETPDGLRCAGGKGKPGTRLKFPQVSADLSVRWCSAYLKIDVCTIAIRNQKRFTDKRTLVLTGERGEESTARSKYKVFEPDRAHSATRHVDHWRPILDWKETAVWKIIEQHRINPHPAYHLGWGRLSCAACIFGSPNQWATLRGVDPDKFETVAEYPQVGVKIVGKQFYGGLFARWHGQFPHLHIRVVGFPQVILRVQSAGGFDPVRNSQTRTGKVFEMTHDPNGRLGFECNWGGRRRCTGCARDQKKWQNRI